MSKVFGQLVRIAAWLSQGINVLFLYGHQDQTVSSRLYSNRNKKYWNAARKTVNFVFFWQEDHCYKSYKADVDWALEMLNK